MNKIISMSVYGENPRYIIGAKKQYKIAKKLYTDWTVRIYTDKAINFVDIDADIREMPKSPNGVFWRFEPMFESPNNITMVRDSDGRITIREAIAINEWLNSGKSFHTFRDHEAHFQFPIIACAFAFKGKLPPEIKIAMNYFMDAAFYYTNDQVFLRDYVWPYVKDDSLVHDMNTGWFKDTREKLKNRYEFCGNGWDENDMPLYPPFMSEMKGFDIKKLDSKYKFDEGTW